MGIPGLVELILVDLIRCLLPNTFHVQRGKNELMLRGTIWYSVLEHYLWPKISPLESLWMQHFFCHTPYRLIFSL
jgi:hypothetical protein